MSQHPPIRLRYFDARARAQFMRAYFDVRGIAYEDDRVPLDEGFASWQGMRDDRSRTGPMQRLPVLHYGDELIPETIVIGNFVHRRLGDADALTDDQNLQHEVILSVCNIDLMLPLAMLIWADLMFDGIDLASYARKTLERVRRNLEVLEKAIDDWGWDTDVASRPVTVADCILWEELDQAKTLFGSHLSLDGKPLLARFHDEHPSRETFQQLLEDRPCQISGRPGEAAAIERVRGLLA